MLCLTLQPTDDTEPIHDDDADSAHGKRATTTTTTDRSPKALRRTMIPDAPQLDASVGFSAPTFALDDRVPPDMTVEE